MNVDARTIIEVERPVGEVFEYFADMRNEPDWNHGHVHSVQKVTDGPVGLGTVFIGGHAGFGEASWRITEYDPPRRIRIEGHLGRGRYEYEGSFRTTARGTHMEGLVRWSPQGLLARAPFLAPLIRARARRSFRNFARHFGAPARIQTSRRSRRW